jgi:hypothetical protein
MNMDSIGDYIYLIVIIIAAISSVMKKKKKKEEQSRPGQEMFPDLDDVIPEYSIPEPRVFIPEPIQVKKENVVEKIDNLQGYESVADFKKVKAKKSVHVEIKKPVEFKDVEQEPDSEFRLDSMDEVRKAFIYSEILAKKY